MLSTWYRIQPTNKVGQSGDKLYHLVPSTLRTDAKGAITRVPKADRDQHIRSISFWTNETLTGEEVIFVNADKCRIVERPALTYIEPGNKDSELIPAINPETGKPVQDITIEVPVSAIDLSKSFRAVNENRKTFAGLTDKLRAA